MSHPSEDILGSKGEELKGKKIVMCVTGSVAATKSPEIARQLMRHSAEVFTVMTDMAQTIIHPYLMQWATGKPVVTELTGNIEHVQLAGEHPDKADLVLVAPATANTLSKIACGIDDTPVTSVVSTALGSGIPLIIVPAMHQSMYHHPILTENIRKLKSLGVEFVGPRIEEGKAKIAETGEVLEAVLHTLSTTKNLKARKIMVTAGPTYEYIDPIRVIANKSSGKMGVAVAQEALARGAEVTLIYGPGTAIPPNKAKIISVETSQEMYDAVVSELQANKYQVMIATAAVADWTLEEPYPYKVSTKDVPELTLKLKPTPKIIEVVKKLSPNTLLVPFRVVHRLSDQEIVENGYTRLKQAKADLIAVNDVARKGVGFQVETNELYLITKEKEVIHIPLTTKREAAQKLLDTITKMLK